MDDQQEFASMAEAVAYFYNQGYVTIGGDDKDRLMVRGVERVMLMKVGFMEVVAEKY